jgi:hypothetical protein
MRNVLVIGVPSDRGPLSANAFARTISNRLGLHALVSDLAAVELRQRALAHAATDGGFDHSYATPSTRVDAIIWLHFSPRLYFRDWLAGWLDRALHGTDGRTRQRTRAKLADFFGACLALLVAGPSEPEYQSAVTADTRVVELRTPAEASFWIYLEEERQRERRASI